MDTKINWMNVELSSPFILASITPFSSMCVEEHASFFRKAIDYGAGAIVLPSVNPDTDDMETNSHNINARVNPIKTGKINKKDSFFAFSLLGSTSNIASLGYVKSLQKSLSNAAVSSTAQTPVFASIANIGNFEQFTHTLITLAGLDGISGIELNFSCPNVITSNKDEFSETNGLLGLHLLTVDLLKQVRQICKGMPISIKLPPYMDYSRLVETAWEYIDGLTISNAYIGLEPPIVGAQSAMYDPAFASYSSWSPTGIYGPFERPLTYRDIYRAMLTLEHDRYGNISVSCVGGMVTAEQALAAIMLGASTVQLSSAIAWNGLQSFQIFNAYLEKFMNDHKLKRIDDIRGVARNSILDSADQKTLSKKANRIAQIDTIKCLKCKLCSCCEKFCLAIKQDTRGELPRVNSALCSGCGWCKEVCTGGAISMRSMN